MRILHTADWHMNLKLGRQSLAEDIRDSLRQIAGYLEAHQVDVMIVAGDILESISRIDAMKQAVRDIKDIFHSFLHRGGTIIAISGNHDNEVFFEMLRDALELVLPNQKGPMNTHLTGRLYVSPNPQLLRLADREGKVVQFVMMPYPRARVYLSQENVKYSTPEEKNRAIQDQFRATLKHIEQKLDPHLPSVLVSHVLIRGIRPNTNHALSELEDVVFEPGDIPTYWAYAAYGHIHKPQPAISGIPDTAHIRYSGSIVRTSGNERDDQKSVVIADIDQSGSTQLQLLPLHIAPMYRIVIEDPDAELPTLAERYPDADKALVHYTLHWDPARHDRHTLCKDIEAVFPRWYDRVVQSVGRLQQDQPQLEIKALHNVAGVVRSYLDIQLKDDPNRDQLLSLVEGLLNEGGAQ